MQLKKFIKTKNEEKSNIFTHIYRHLREVKERSRPRPALTWFRECDYFRCAAIKVVRFRLRGPRAGRTRAVVLVHDVLSDNSAATAATVLLIPGLLGPVQSLHDHLPRDGRCDVGLLLQAELGQDLALDRLEPDLIAVLLRGCLVALLL